MNSIVVGQKISSFSQKFYGTFNNANKFRAMTQSIKLRLIKTLVLPLSDYFIFLHTTVILVRSKRRDCKFY
jgi:hypothetical protein